MFLKSMLYFVFIALVLPFSGMATNDEVKSRFNYSSNNQKIIKPGRKIQIPNYNTYIVCEYFGDIKRLTQSQFFIFRENDKQKIGEILLQYYPQGGYYKTAGETPTLRLRHIEINEEYRRQYHATRALETLFTALRKAPLLPQESEIWLEYSSCYPYLAKFYGDFGFEVTNEPSFAETKVLNVKLNSTKFPYYKKLKKK